MSFVQSPVGPAICSRCFPLQYLIHRCLELHTKYLESLLYAQADVGDPQTVSNSLAPFLSLATAVTGATGVAATPQPSASGSAGADPSAPVVGASGGEVSEEAITASTAATAEKPVGAGD